MFEDKRETGDLSRQPGFVERLIPDGQRCFHETTQQSFPSKEDEEVKEAATRLYYFVERNYSVWRRKPGRAVTMFIATSFQTLDKPNQILPINFLKFSRVFFDFSEGLKRLKLKSPSSNHRVVREFFNLTVLWLKQTRSIHTRASLTMRTFDRSVEISSG